MAEQKKIIKLKDISSYSISYKLSNYIWKIIISWNYFYRDTIGKQFVRAIDSISANIAEWFGRYNKSDKIRFYRISFGSLYESLDWNQKAYQRKLLTEEQYLFIFNELKKLPLAINTLIKITKSNLSK